MTTDACYRVRDWKEFFEKRHATEREVAFRWVAMPTKRGKSYNRLARQSLAVDAFCGWCLILQEAAKTIIRGVLCDENGPLTSRDLADATMYPERVFDAAFELLADPDLGINWLEKVDPAVTHADVLKAFHRRAKQKRKANRNKSQPSRDKSPYKTEQDNTGQYRTKQKRARAKRGAGEMQATDEDERALALANGESKS